MTAVINKSEHRAGWSIMYRSGPGSRCHATLLLFQQLPGLRLFIFLSSTGRQASFALTDNNGFCRETFTALTWCRACVYGCFACLCVCNVFMPVVYCLIMHLYEIICTVCACAVYCMYICVFMHAFMFVHVCIYHLYPCLSVRGVNRIGVEGLFAVCVWVCDSLSGWLPSEAGIKIRAALIKAKNTHI